MNNSQHKQFDGELLERYRRGELSPSEAHALEMASMEDPLLAEALEGFYSSSRSSESELKFLNEWVNQRVDESQAAIRFIPKNRSFAPLLRVAAVFLVLIGAAWMGYIFWLEPKQPLLADNRSAQSAEQKPADSLPATQAAPGVVSTPAPATPVEVPVAAPVTAQSNSTSPIPADNEEPSGKQNLLAAAPMAKQESSTPESNMAQRQKISSDESVSESDKISVKEGARRLATDLTASEVAPSPVVGWTAFEEYVDQNKVSAPTASNTTVALGVILSFDVSKEGRPANIKVEKSAGSFYDQRAIELLQKGPSWTPSKSGKRGELRLRF